MRRRADCISVICGFRTEIVRKDIKHIYIRVCPGEDIVRVSAPHRVSAGAIEELLAERSARISRALGAACGPLRKFSAADRREFLEMCRDALSRWEPVVGKRASSVAVRDMSSRWGSCNAASGRICFNLKLMDMEPVFLDYVACHELCHLHVCGHGPDFWARMDSCFPEWKKVRKALNGKG